MKLSPVRIDENPATKIPTAATATLLSAKAVL